MKFFHAYSDPVFAEYVPGESKTTQAAKEDADINVIVGRFIRAGISPAETTYPEHVVDTTELPDNLMDAAHLIREADEARLSLEASLREANAKAARQKIIDEYEASKSKPEPKPEPDK